ncbi:MAG: DUF58 domain-containing protein [Kiritimatiellia bacterium]
MKKRHHHQQDKRAASAASPADDSVEARLLDSRTVGKAALLGLTARKIVEGSMAGLNKSPLSGFAIEFRQHREYTPGDELKHVDWKLYGKTDRFYIKQYEQETNFDCSLLLDASESMAYGKGSQNKLEYGRVLASVFSYLVLSERNRLTLQFFDREVEDTLPPTSNPGSLHNLCELLVAREPTRQTAIGDILRKLADRLRTRGICIIISDFFDDTDAVVKGLRRLSFQGQEVIVFHVMHPDELEFPFDGTVEFDGFEVADIQTLQPRRIRESYLKTITAFRKDIQKACEQNDITYTLVDTSKSPEEIISGFLTTRMHYTGR